MVVIRRQVGRDQNQSPLGWFSNFLFRGSKDPTARSSTSSTSALERKVGEEGDG